jgi:hypothetical protein
VTTARVRQPASLRISARVRFDLSSAENRSRTPCLPGYAPVMIDATACGVLGSGLDISVKTALSEANASRCGVEARARPAGIGRPSRSAAIASARRVSTVISRMLGARSAGITRSKAIRPSSAPRTARGTAARTLSDRARPRRPPGSRSGGAISEMPAVSASAAPKPAARASHAAGVRPATPSRSDARGQAIQRTMSGVKDAATLPQRGASASPKARPATMPNARAAPRDH